MSMDSGLPQPFHPRFNTFERDIDQVEMGIYYVQGKNIMSVLDCVPTFGASIYGQGLLQKLINTMKLYIEPRAKGHYGPMVRPAYEWAKMLNLQCAEEGPGSYLSDLYHDVRQLLVSYVVVKAGDRFQKGECNFQEAQYNDAEPIMLRNLLRYWSEAHEQNLKNRLEPFEDSKDCPGIRCVRVY